MNNNTPSKKRFMLLLDDVSKSSLKKTEKEFNTRITSSAELSSKVRSKNIYDSGNGLFLKNIGIVVIEEEDLKKVQSFCASRTSPGIYYEESKKVFRPVTELDLIAQLRSTTSGLANQINELEDYLKSKEDKKNSQQMTWGLNALGLNNTNLNGEGVEVCILDTGFYADHPDFAGREIMGKSFVANQSWDDDVNGHGTHCTGTAVGSISKENGIRYGIASGARIAIGKVLDNNGDGATDWIVDAIDLCIEKKYKVVSMSFGASVGIGESPSQMFEHIGQVAIQKNCLLIAAAGNESNRPSLPRPVNSPANCESIMAIAALQKSLNVASFSNGGINVSNGGRIDVSAPGVEIYSSFSPNAPGNTLYKTYNGTSMATPHVSGLAALYCQKFPNKSAAEIWMKLEKNARQLNNQLIRDVGNGIVQSI